MKKKWRKIKIRLIFALELVKWSHGRAVRLSSAKAATAVRIRL